MKASTNIIQKQIGHSPDLPQLLEIEYEGLLLSYDDLLHDSVHMMSGLVVSLNWTLIQIHLRMCYLGPDC